VNFLLRSLRRAATPKLSFVLPNSGSTELVPGAAILSRPPRPLGFLNKEVQEDATQFSGRAHKPIKQKQGAALTQIGT